MELFDELEQAAILRTEAENEVDRIEEEYQKCGKELSTQKEELKKLGEWEEKVRLSLPQELGSLLFENGKLELDGEVFTRTHELKKAHDGSSYMETAKLECASANGRVLNVELDLAKLLCLLRGDKVHISISMGSTTNACNTCKHRYECLTEKKKPYGRKYKKDCGS